MPEKIRSTRRTLIQSVERALDILEFVGNASEPVRNSAIAEYLNVSAATANNIIRTLYIRGYLNQHRGGRYTLGMQSFVLGSNADIGRELRAVSLEPLQRLSRATQVTCFLGVFYQRQVVAINVIESRNPISVSLRQRWLDQYHSTAAGKVLLSALPEDELEIFLEQMPLHKLTERTICDPELLKKDLHQVRHQGYAVVCDESVFGVSSLGIPVSSKDGKVIAALSTAFSSYFLDEVYLKNQLALLHKTKNEIEKRLWK